MVVLVSGVVAICTANSCLNATPHWMRKRDAVAKRSGAYKN
jgi:hypothetical protein